jgi:hypothetical protein
VSGWSRGHSRKKAGPKLAPGWTPLYERTLQTDAVRTLSAFQFRVYIVALALCKPWKNGAVPLVRGVMVKSGITSNGAAARAIAELLNRRLLVRTRKARPKHAAMYGVTHLPLDAEAMREAGIYAPPDGTNFAQDVGQESPPNGEAESGPGGGRSGHSLYSTQPNREAV